VTTTSTGTGASSNSNHRSHPPPEFAAVDVKDGNGDEEGIAVSLMTEPPSFSSSPLTLTLPSSGERGRSGLSSPPSSSQQQKKKKTKTIAWSSSPALSLLYY